MEQLQVKRKRMSLGEKGDGEDTRTADEREADGRDMEEGGGYE